MLVDTHCHLTSAGLVERLDEVLAAARQAGVQQLITVAQNLADTEAALDLAGSHENIYLAAAIHPHESNRCDLGTFEALTELLRDPAQSLAAGGAPGGGRRDGAGFSLRFFSARAPAGGLPGPSPRGTGGRFTGRNPRSRGRTPNLRDSQAEFPNLAERAVFHCYSGDPNLTRGVLDLGCTCFVYGRGDVPEGGVDPGGGADRAIRPYHGRDRRTVSLARAGAQRPALRAGLGSSHGPLPAELRDTDFDTFAAQTTLNARRFFGLPEV